LANPKALGRPQPSVSQVVRDLPLLGLSPSRRLQPMFAFLRRLFPERIFRRKLEPAAERRLRLAAARAEESIIRAHVDNALMFVDTLAEDMSFDRAIETYIREMSIPEPLASVVATRTLVVLGQDLVPYRRRAVDTTENDTDDRPKLRLNDASQGRQPGDKRTIKRA
jgi:hypothetical protein